MTLLGAYLVPHDRPVWSGGLVALLSEFGFSNGAARAALARMVRRGRLDRLRQGRLVSYRPTPGTVALLEEGDRRIFSLGREPHRAYSWTVLWHAIPEERRLERGRLARRLRFLGFGSVGDGMWISPHDREREVVGLVRELRVAEDAGVMLGRPAAALDFRALVSRAWDLDALDGRYRAFHREFAPYQKSSGVDDRESFLLRTRLVHAFRRFPALDPELPDDLVRAPRHRAEAVALFHRLYDALAPAAQRHFEAATTPP
ncbi:MAG: PaaX family transcriptional regulator [Thermoleophilaceae bacterium]|nr:PaaX family transcriptional regulator [Thermoleophilaceae bacterium]